MGVYGALGVLRLLPGGPSGVAALELDDVEPGAAQGGGGHGVADPGLAVAHDHAVGRQLVGVPEHPSGVELFGAGNVSGGVLGLVQGLIIVFIVVIIAHMAVALSNNTLIFLNEMTINKSYAFSWVYNFSFLDFLN